jgi:hypothetical protein
MCPARLSAPVTASSRWTDEEHDLLVDLTNEQLALEAQDPSNVISWNKHWMHVSSQLQKAGYYRTVAACKKYWKRTIGVQMANEEAAGPRWEDTEHQILLGMTEDQLELEAIDPSATMPWARHWKRVSDRLKEEGFPRSGDACEAYWNLVQDNSPLVAGGVADAETESSDEPYEIKFRIDNERSGSKEASESHPEACPESAPAQSKPSVLLPYSANVEENIPAMSEHASMGVAKPPSFQKGDSQRRMTTPQDEAPNLSGEASSQKLKGRQFRFTSDQRAVLEQEVARNGPNPDQGRRKELARDLDVEENTVKVRGT